MSPPAVSYSILNYDLPNSTAVSVSFTFSESEGHVGEPLPSQIAVTSRAQPKSAPVTLSNVLIQLKGCISEIQLFHHLTDIQTTTASGEMSRIVELTLEESTPTSRSEQKPRWVGSSDLT